VKKFEVVLLRQNGRFVKTVTVNSKYAAETQRRKWEEGHDATYRVEVRLVEVS
jgi:hypothetical protein